MQYMLTSDGNCILRKDENGIISSVPFDEKNDDYKQYLVWVGQGNSAISAGGSWS